LAAELKKLEELEK
jgi:hypothetical protein